MRGEKYRDASKSQLITRKLKRIEAYARRYEKMIKVEINELRRMLEIFKSGGVGDIVGAASFFIENIKEEVNYSIEAPQFGQNFAFNGAAEPQYGHTL
ncbi:MAG: hypothetical protein J7L07_00440 [Candidatus Odinarchaeota archaeon]|nr:hypothetical protein [Candidatus Odinarchaeota archaeon]